MCVLQQGTAGDYEADHWVELTVALHLVAGGNQDEKAEVEPGPGGVVHGGDKLCWVHVGE